MRILLVEDEQAIATLIRRTFHREGLTVVCAGSVRDACALLEGRGFDVAILDRSLPDGSGLEVMDAIRRDDGHATHIVVLSGASREEDRVEALDRGADDYVVKPFFVRELLARVTAIGRRKQWQDPVRVAAPRQQDPYGKTGSLIHVHGRIVDVDSAFVSLVGATSREELLQRDVYSLVASASLPAARARYETAREGTWPGSQTLQLEALDGRELFVEVTSQRVVWNGQDASDLQVREVEPASVRWRQLSTGVFGEVSDAVIITDPQLHILSWNTAACELYGWPEAEVLGRRVTDILPWDGDQVALERAAEDLASTGHWHGQARQTRRDGTPVEVAASVRTLTDDTDGIVAVVSVNRPLPRAVDPEIRSEDLADLAELRHAIAEGHIAVHHQPIVHLHDRRMVGTEALVRWIHPTRGAIPAAQFVSAAERNGGIVELGRLVLRTACAQTARWRQEGHDLHVAVNISAQQLAHDGLTADVDRALEESGLPPELLWLEVTETSLVEDVQRATTTLHGLAARGVRIAIDDFGTGWASLTYLKQFPVHALKIDRSFVSGIERSAQDLAIARSILALGLELGLEVIAEGIESEEQDAVLRALGCIVGQGYLYGRPLPPADVPIFLARQVTKRD